VTSNVHTPTGYMDNSTGGYRQEASTYFIGNGGYGPILLMRLNY